MADIRAAREAFEKWATSRGIYARRRDGEYPDSTARFCWDVWQAAWESARNPPQQKP